MGLLSSTHIHGSKKEYVPYEKNVTVHEHRAPTDQSVELMNEFSEKALKNIVHRLHVDNNTLKAKGIYSVDDLNPHRMRYDLKFQLNGRDYYIDGFIEYSEFREAVLEQWNGFAHERIFKAAMKKVSEVIAEELMSMCPEFPQKTLEQAAR